MKCKDIYQSTKTLGNNLKILSITQNTITIEYKNSVMNLKHDELRIITNSVNNVICIEFDYQFFI
jgi:hypothetical protein